MKSNTYHVGRWTPDVFKNVVSKHRLAKRQHNPSLLRGVYFIENTVDPPGDLIVGSEEAYETAFKAWQLKRYAVFAKHHSEKVLTNAVRRA